MDYRYTKKLILLLVPFPKNALVSFTEFQTKCLCVVGFENLSVVDMNLSVLLVASILIAFVSADPLLDKLLGGLLGVNKNVENVQSTAAAQPLTLTSLLDGLLNGGLGGLLQGLGGVDEKISDGVSKLIYLIKIGVSLLESIITYYTKINPPS